MDHWIALVLFVASASAVPVTHPELGYVNDWVKTGPVHDGSIPVLFTLVVKEQGIETIRRIASEVSNPDSAKYGAYLGQQELDLIVAPKAEDMTTVTEWLDAHSLDWTRRGVSNIDVHSTVQAVSAALNTQFHHIYNGRTAQHVVRAGDYDLPVMVHAAVDAVFGLHGLPIPPHVAVTQLQGGDAPANVTPGVIWETYVVKDHKVSGSTHVRQAVAEFQGEYYNDTDLKKLFADYLKGEYATGDDEVYRIVGQNLGVRPGVEAELDIQYMMGVSPGVKSEFWSFPSMDFGADLNMWTSNLSANADIPLVHSVSYGWQGELSRIHVKPGDVAVVDRNFAKLAAKGISIMISSGDSGSGYTPPQYCSPQPSGHCGEPGIAIQGTVEREVTAGLETDCCFMASAGAHPAAGWTFVPNHTQPTPTVYHTQDAANFTFANTLFHVSRDDCDSSKARCGFRTNQEFQLNGSIGSAGGDVTVTPVGSDAASTLHFGKLLGLYRNVSGTFGGMIFTGSATS